MVELVMLIPFFVVGLVFFLTFDLKRKSPNQPTFQKRMPKVENESIDEMKRYLVEYYGKKKLIEKNFNNYDDLFEEVSRIDRNKYAE
jgi:uncharacterized membrane-anchored protein YhcB (DUF1043 family)